MVYQLNWFYIAAFLQFGYFRFNDLFFEQIKGLAMVSRATQTLAILYVYNLTVEKPLENDFTYIYIYIIYVLNYIPKPVDIDVQYWDRYMMFFQLWKVMYSRSCQYVMLIFKLQYIFKLYLNYIYNLLDWKTWWVYNYLLLLHLKPLSHHPERTYTIRSETEMRGVTIDEDPLIF